MYFTDWTDRGECHDTDADNAHRENGRIYTLCYGKPRPVHVDLAAASHEDLARLQLHKNDWHVRTARRLLQERAAQGADLSECHRILQSILRTNPDTTRRLRALWALHATDGFSENALVGLLDDADESIRGWAVRLLWDRGTPSAKAIGRFVSLARSDSSPRVRLNLASALQRIPVDDRWPLAEALVACDIDPTDPMLPLMTWYGVEPLAGRDPSRASALAARCKLPLHRNFLARRAVAADTSRGLAALLPVLEQSLDAIRIDILSGILEALRGHKQVPRPQGWSGAFAKLLASHDPDVVAQTLLLALDIGEPRAVATLRSIVADRGKPTGLRSRALTALVERRTPDLASDLPALLDDSMLRGAAIRALAAYNDPMTPQRLLSRYASFSGSERDDVITTLAARPAWALAMLDAVGNKTIPRRDLNTTVARQMQASGDEKVRTLLESVWGSIRPTSKDKASLITKYKALLASSQPQAADPGRGRLVFNKTCHQCHKLFDSGGDVGPDLTGSDRANADYILENVLDPSAVVAREYTLSNVATTDGRFVSGIIREQNDRSITIQTANERITLPREDVEEIKTSNASMMPEGQLEQMTPQEVRDLFAYLASSRQVPAAPAH